MLRQKFAAKPLVCAVRQPATAACAVPTDVVVNALQGAGPESDATRRRGNVNVFLIAATVNVVWILSVELFLVDLVMVPVNGVVKAGDA